MNFKTEIEKFDTQEIINSKLVNWEFFKNSTILVTGATGLIGSQTIISLLYANEIYNTNIKILALVRNKNKAEAKFKDIKTDNLKFVIQDITTPIDIGYVDFVIHTANGTASKGFVETPVETIDTIVSGTKNILNYAQKQKIKSLVYLSSMEVYGNIGLDRTEPLKEIDLGYMDTMKVRNSYSLGKRLAENMCYSYFTEYSVPVKVARLSQTIGSSIDYNDNRVFMQFTRNVIEKQNIVLHTEGATIRSYCYITDAVVAILLMLEKGKNGEVYNIGGHNEKTNLEVVKIILKELNKSENLIKYVTDRPGHDMRYAIDPTKIHTELGWLPATKFEDGIKKTIKWYLDNKTWWQNIINGEYKNYYERHYKGR